MTLRDYVELPRSVHLLCLGTLVNRAGTFIIPFLTLYLTKHLGLDVPFATFAMGLLGLGSILGSFIGGLLADRIGRRKTMMIALCGSAATLFVYSALRTPAAILTATLLFSLLGDMYRPAASAMIADLVEPIRRPHAFALMYVSINLGFAIGPVVGGELADMHFNFLFYGDAATTLVFAAIIFFAIRESRPLRGDSGADAASSAGEIRLTAALRHILTNVTFLWVWFAGFLLGVVFMQATSTFPLYLSGLGFDPKTYGRVIAVNGALIVFAQIPITAWVYRQDRGAVLAVAALFVAVGFALFSFGSTAWYFAFAVMVWTLGEMMQAPLIGPIVADLAPAELRGRYMGVLMMSFAGAIMVGVPLGGLSLKNFGGVWTWFLSSGVALLAGVIYWSARRRIAVPRAASDGT